MTKEAVQSNETEEMPTSTALRFVKRKQEQDSKACEEILAHSDETSMPAKPKPKLKATVAPESKEVVSPTPASKKARIYEPFSTRIRHDLKRQLKRLSHKREDEGHEVFQGSAVC